MRGLSNISGGSGSALPWPLPILSQRQDLRGHRRLVGLSLLVFLWMLVPVLAWQPTGSRSPDWRVDLAGGGIAAMASLLWGWRPDARLTRLGMGFALLTMIALVTDGGGDGPWQHDAPTCFAAALALLAAYADTEVILVGTAIVLIHHLALQAIRPHTDPAGDATLVRLLLQSGLILLEAAALVLLSTNATARARPLAVPAPPMIAPPAPVPHISAVPAPVTAAPAATQLPPPPALVTTEEARWPVEAIGLAMKQANAITAWLDSNDRQSHLAAEASSRLMGGMDDMKRHVTEAATSIAKASSSSQTAETAVRRLASLTETIGQVAGFIARIANQTNLLALNATIEAARAGDAGRSFAIVASEVKTLARQTAAATDDIRTRIDQIQSATDEAVDSVQALSAHVTAADRVGLRLAAAAASQREATADLANDLDATARRAAGVRSDALALRETLNAMQSRPVPTWRPARSLQVA